MATLLAALTLLPSRPSVAASPAAACQATRNTVIGAYSLCRQRAEAQLATTRNTSAHAAGLARCVGKAQKAWGRSESKASAKNASCAASGDLAVVRAFVDEHTTSVAALLAGASATGCLAERAGCATALAECTGEASACSTALRSAQAGLAACTTDLGTCTTDLANVTSQVGTCTGTLATCNQDLGTAQDALSGCTDDLATCNVTRLATDGDLDTCVSERATCTADLQTCEADLATCQATPLGQRLRTGQTLCYDASANVTSCTGTGQDGERQAGLARAFTDNGDGTITDRVTGLMWEKLSDDGSIHDVDDTYAWAAAVSSKIATLNSTVFAGYTDWRVPNVTELATLRSLGTSNPPVPSVFGSGCPAGCTVFTCSCTRATTYWSSTTHHNTPGSAWTVSFIEGVVGFSSKGAATAVRAVRGGA